MSYSADDHAVFSRRGQKAALRFEALRREAAALVEIYVNETASGEDAEFVDTPIASKQEHIDLVNYLLAFAAFNENDSVATLDRTQILTPFLQVD